MYITNTITNNKDLRNFGILLGTMILVLFGIFFPWMFNKQIPWSWTFNLSVHWPWTVTGILWMIAFSIPQILQPIHWGWLTIGNVLNWINTRLILTLLFYLIFTSLGLMMRMLGKDPMNRRFKSNEKSYRVESDTPEKNHIERPY